MNFKSFTFTLNKCLIIRKKKSNYKMKICIVLHFKPLGVRCEITMMPLNQDSGRDT